MADTRTLTYFVASSIDGFIAGPDASDPSGPGGFWPITDDYVAYLAEEYPETLPVAARTALGITAEGHRFDTVLEGRRSYEVGLEAGVTDAYPHLRHLVFSTTLDSLPDPAVELVREDPAERVRALKREPGKGLWIVGGGTLASALRSEIDELIVKLSPITLGAGVPLWGQGTGFEVGPWTRREVSALPGGTTVLRYTAAASA